MAGSYSMPNALATQSGRSGGAGGDVASPAVSRSGSLAGGASTGTSGSRRRGPPRTPGLPKGSGAMRADLYDSTRYQIGFQEDDAHGKLHYPRRCKRLDLTNNYSMKEPPENLPVTLEHLDLPSTLDYLPPSIGRLVNLKVLRINSHGLKTLPPELALCCRLTTIYLAESTRMDSFIWEMYLAGPALPMKAGRDPGPLMDYLRPLIGIVKSVRPKRPFIERDSVRRKAVQRNELLASLGIGTAELTNTAKKTKKKKKKTKKKDTGGGGRGNKLGAALSRTVKPSTDGSLTAQQLTYERDLRAWNGVAARAQPPTPKLHGIEIFDYEARVDTSNWPIRGTQRRANRRFINPYEFMQFTQAKPINNTIFKRIDVPDPTAGPSALAGSNMIYRCARPIPEVAASTRDKRLKHDSDIVIKRGGL